MAYTSGDQSTSAFMFVFTILKTIVFGANQPWVNVFWVMCHLLIVIT